MTTDDLIITHAGRHTHEAAATTSEARAQIQREAGRLYSLYSGLAIDRATALLEALYEAGEQHGVPTDKWATAVNLPMAVLTVLGDWRDDIPQGSDAINMELERLDDALRVSGVAAHTGHADPDSHEEAQRGLVRVRVPRRPHTPPWGREGDADLEVKILSGLGWCLAPYEQHPTLKAIVAPFGVDGTVTVADVVNDVLNGVYDNPFKQP